jgi:hypothetical protein
MMGMFLCAGVLVDVVIDDGPTPCLGVRAGMIDLPRHRPLLLGDACLIGALARVNRCNHLIQRSGTS